MAQSEAHGKKNSGLALFNEDEEIFARREIFYLWIAGVAFLIVAKIAEKLFTDDVNWGFDPWALAGPFIALILFQRSHRYRLGIILLSCILGIGIGITHLSILLYSIPFAMWGLALAILLAPLPLVSAKQRAWIYHILMAGSLVLIGQQTADTFQKFTTFENLTFDSRAYLVDLSLGFSPAEFTVNTLNALVPQLLQPACRLLMLAVYDAITAMMLVVVLLQLKRQSERWLIALIAMVIAGVIGGILYHVFPAVGPSAFFHKPVNLPSGAGMQITPDAVDTRLIRNCMPSLHITWALLAIINSKGLPRWVQIFSIIFAVITLIFILASREHYLIDAIVAVPYTIAIQSLSKSVVNRTRLQLPFWIGTLFTVFWLYALVVHAVWFTTVQGFTVTLTILSIAVSVGSLGIGKPQPKANRAPAA